jgi:hypothetical protein
VSCCRGLDSEHEWHKQQPVLPRGKAHCSSTWPISPLISHLVTTNCQETHLARLLSTVCAHENIGQSCYQEKRSSASSQHSPLHRALIRSSACTLSLSSDLADLDPHVCNELSSALLSSTHPANVSRSSEALLAPLQTAAKSDPVPITHSFHLAYHASHITRVRSPAGSHSICTCGSAWIFNIGSDPSSAVLDMQSLC